MLKNTEKIAKRIRKSIIKKIRDDNDKATDYSKNNSSVLKDRIIEAGIVNYLSFDYSALKQRTLGYVESLHLPNGHVHEYKYTQNGTKSNIYNSIYACILLSLYGESNNLPESSRKTWIDYFNSLQDSNSGLFIDPTIRNEYYDNSDWWGARHLIPQIIYAYLALEAKPKYEFNWVKNYYDKNRISELIDSCDWNSAIPDENDIDNKIMNIGVTLQYQRDYWEDGQAADSVKHLKNILLEKINPSTGLWGKFDVHNSYELPRMIQFAYHILRIFIYDRDTISNAETIIDLALMSQNKYGGFGEKLNSSACEDIDAIDILIYLSKQTSYRSHDINIAIQRALIFILSNQNDDGGFVFRRDEPLWYGHNDMYSDSNVSALFPTWFRTLSIAHICNYGGIGKYTLLNCPGY